MTDLVEIPNSMGELERPTKRQNHKSITKQVHAQMCHTCIPFQKNQS